MKKQNIEPKNFLESGDKFSKQLQSLIKFLNDTNEINNYDSFQSNLQNEIFKYEKLLNEELLMYNQACLNINSYCLQKLKELNFNLYQNNNIENVIEEIGNILNNF